MIFKVVSGGQTGVDQAALLAARACGIVTGGYVPYKWKTESGPAPWLAEFGLEELGTPDYAKRTLRVTMDAHAMLWLGDASTPGGRCTKHACYDCMIPTLFSTPSLHAIDVVAWLRRLRPRLVLMVAGNRESKSPGIGLRSQRFLNSVFSTALAEQNLAAHHAPAG